MHQYNIGLRYVISVIWRLTHLCVVVYQLALGHDFLIPLAEVGLLGDGDSIRERNHQGFLAARFGRGRRHGSLLLVIVSSAVDFVVVSDSSGGSCINVKKESCESRERDLRRGTCGGGEIPLAYEVLNYSNCMREKKRATIGMHITAIFY